MLPTLSKTVQEEHRRKAQDDSIYSSKFNRVCGNFLMLDIILIGEGGGGVGCFGLPFP